MNSNQYLLITQFGVNQSDESQVAKQWNNVYQNSGNRKLYRKRGKSDFLELLLLDSPASFEAELNNDLRHTFNQAIKPLMRTDWRQEILSLKDVVVTNEQPLPDTKYLQLRYIEVPLSVYDEYFQWRKRTIFDYVKKFPQIDYFTAYHSILSTKPGVMFLSGFSGDVDQYMSIFNADQFQRISNEAKAKYIYGGDQGLSLTMYEKI